MADVDSLTPWVYSEQIEPHAYIEHTYGVAPAASEDHGCPCPVCRKRRGEES